jgi:hypothetical protein
MGIINSEYKRIRKQLSQQGQLEETICKDPNRSNTSANRIFYTNQREITQLSNAFSLYRTTSNHFSRSVAILTGREFA